MDQIFNPTSIVVIGVSNRPDNLGQYIIGNLRAFQYKGALYAVGREKSQVHGLQVEESLEDVPDGLDLAVIITPAKLVPQFVEKCGQKKIFNIVIESGGFSEYSEEGRKLEEEILEIAARMEMKIVGPNCISVVNLEAGVCLPFGSLSPDTAHLGRGSIISQSGGVSLTLMGMLSAAGVGANKVVSIGNKADLDETDYLEYLLQDEGTELVLLYLESISQGRKLLDLASTSPKPILTLKANRGVASQSIAFSHTAALANDDRIVDAAFRQARIFRADGFRDLVAMAQGLVLPPVRGDELIIISRSGGHAVAAADSAEKYGFKLPPLPEAFIELVQKYFRTDVIALTNPLDLGVIFDFEIYAQIVEQCLRLLSPDCILLINTYSEAEEEGALTLARKVAGMTNEIACPIAFCVYAGGTDLRDIQHEIGMPIYEDIEEAIMGLDASRRWAAWQPMRADAERPFSKYFEPTTTPLSLANGPLSAEQILPLCQKYQISTAAWEIIFDEDEADAAASRIGFPLALKIIDPNIVHKTDVGGVVLGLQTPDQLREAMRKLRPIAGNGEIKTLPSFMVQRMVGGGVEVILGAKRDPTFGPVVLFGLGGIFVEVYDDIAFRVAPITRRDAEQMISEVQGAYLLEGFRGQEPADRESLIQAMLSLSQLMMENSHLSEIEINPLIVTPEEAIAVDARAIING